MASFTFDIEIQDMGPALAIVVPDDVVDGLGGKSVPVLVTVKDFTFRARTAVMGGRNLVGINRANRTASGVEPGEVVTVVLAADDAPRVVEVPPELADGLAADDHARQTWESLSYSHQREYAEWITGAKKAETRERRVATAVEKLAQGAKSPR
jgi:hypothetical protein